MHFYNCHGAINDSKFYGQKGLREYPTAQHAPDLDGRISDGTIVAAECCYGAETFNPSDEGEGNLSIANTYLKNKAIAFTGSSTIAYGPASGNDLADLITQYFIKKVINGASTGRALLEARQEFLSKTGPQLDPYELKTLAQFYLLGDPSIQALSIPEAKSSAETIENRRMNLSTKGVNLGATLTPSIKVEKPLSKIKAIQSDDMKKIFEKTGFTGNEEEILYEIKSKIKKISSAAKGFKEQKNILFRTFVQKSKVVNGLCTFDVLVIKESGSETLGWKLYHRK